MSEFQYRYNAKIKRWVDADTVVLTIDCGLKIFTDQMIRLQGIDAWEKRGEEKEKGLAALAFCEQLLPVGTDVEIETFKDKSGKYGRYIVTIFVPDSEDTLNDLLVKEGHAEKRDY
jgi:micrococcal nuclease